MPPSLQPRKRPAGGAATPQAAARAAPPVEQELKLRLRPQDLARLRRRLDALASARTESVDSVYFDTPDLRLAQARAALRLRALGSGRSRRWVQTLKTDDGGAAFSLRGEWETPAPGGRFQAALLAASPLAQILAAAAPADALSSGPAAPAPAGAVTAAIPALAPVFRTRFLRTTWDLAAYGARIEVVVDSGWITAGGRRSAILEAELELKGGPAAAIWKLALALSCTGGRAASRADLCLLPYGDSKAVRGYRLALGQAPTPARADRAGGLAGDMPATVAARCLVAAESIPLLANLLGVPPRVDAPADTPADPEFVHQARVGLRRVRTILETLDTSLPVTLERGLRRLGETLGAARDWDVLCGQLLPQLLADLPMLEGAAGARIAAAAQRRRAAAYRALHRLLDSPAFAHFVLRLLQWTGSGEPGTATGAASGVARGRTLAAAAERFVRKRLRRLAREGAGFARRSPERQHRIRLQAKTVRYAMAILAPVLPRGLPGPGRRALSRFQDAAGRVQDAVVVAAAVHDLTRSSALREAVADWAAARRRKAADKAQRAAARLSAGR